MRYIAIFPGNTAVGFESDRPSSDVIRRWAAPFTGRFDRVVAHQGRVDLWVDDESLVVGSAPNALASQLAGRLIVGPALAAGCDAVGATVDVPEWLNAEWMVGNYLPEHQALKAADERFVCRWCYDLGTLVSLDGQQRCDHSGE